MTDLDQWVQFLEPAQPHFEISMEDLIVRLRREEPPTQAMLVGAAFHSFLERARHDVLYEDVEQDGYVFHFSPDLVVTLPPERESLLEKVYETPVGPVLLRGRIDGALGNQITDYKLTLGSFDAERYADSMQWRAYLDMAGATAFRYVVFQANGKELDRGGRNVWIYDLHEFDLWGYPQMGSEVAERVGELAEFVLRHVPEMEATKPKPAPTVAGDDGYGEPPY